MEKGMEFEELEKFIIKRKLARLQANYQPVIIKALLEHGGQLSKNGLVEIIIKNNAELTLEQASEIPVFEVLDKKVIEINGQTISLIFKNYTNDQAKELVTLCNE